MNAILLLVKAWKQANSGVELDFTKTELDVLWRSKPGTSCGTRVIPYYLSDPTYWQALAKSLGELLRLVALAARVGPALLAAFGSQLICPYLDCAWCDHADDTVVISLCSGNCNNAAHLQVVYGALFDWDASTAGHEFIALQEALAEVVSRTQHRNDRRLGLSITLFPDYNDISAYSNATQRLMQTIASQQLGSDGMFIREIIIYLAGHIHMNEPGSSIPIVQALLRHSIGGHVKLRGFSTATLLHQIYHSPQKAVSLDSLQELHVGFQIPDESNRHRTCPMLLMACPRLKCLKLIGGPGGTLGEMEKIMEALGAALFSSSSQLRLEHLDMEKFWWGRGDSAITTRFCRGALTGSNSSSFCAPSLESFVAGRIPPVVLRDVLVAATNLRRLDVTIGTESVADLVSLPSTPLTSLDIRWVFGANPQLEDVRVLLSRLGGSLATLCVRATDCVVTAEWIETIVENCPKLTRLHVQEIVEESVLALANACDEGLCRLRVLHMSERDTTMGVACLRLMLILCDPTQALSRSLRDVYVRWRDSDDISMHEAAEGLHICNSRLEQFVVATLDDARLREPSEQHIARKNKAQARELLNALNALLIDKRLCNGGQPNRDVKVIYPSLRRRLAFLSVVAKQIDKAPIEALLVVLGMAGRPVLTDFTVCFDNSK